MFCHREKKVILSTIPNKEERHYIAVTKLSALLRGITSKIDGDFSCLNGLHSFRTKYKLESPKKVCGNKDFCNTVMFSEEIKILEFNWYRKSDKTPFINYADIESLIEKIDGFKNNPEKSFTTKVAEHISSSFSMSTISLLKDIENKYDIYRGKDCMKEVLWMVGKARK